jgi:hypothetical protein
MQMLKLSFDADMREAGQNVSSVQWLRGDDLLFWERELTRGLIR